MKTNWLLLGLTLLLAGTVYAQRKVYFFKEIDWNIALPPDFTVVSTEDNEQRIKRGADIVENTSDVTVDLSELKTLIAATKNTYNYFTATVTPYNEKTDGNYDSLCNAVNGIMVQAFRAKMKDAVIDTASARQTIDGRTFSRFTVTVKQEGRRLFTASVLHKLYKGYDFGITYLYLDDATGRQMEAMLSESTFRKPAKGTE